MVFLATVLVYLIGTIRPQPISSVIQKEKFWADKTHSDGKYNIIFSGDSRLYRGIDTKTVSEAVSGLKVLNFGYSSGGHNPLIFKEVYDRLDKNAEIKVVALVLTPYSLTPKAQENSHFSQEKKRDEKEVFKRRYINPFLDFFDPIKPMDILEPKSNRARGYHERFRKGGWVESRKVPSDPKSGLKVYQKDFEGNIVEREILEGIYHQTLEWRKQGIKVFGFRIPTTQDMEALENDLSGYDEAQIRMAFEKAGGEWIAISDKYGYTSYDGSHLEGKSAKRFSAFIGSEIQSRLDN